MEFRSLNYTPTFLEKLKTQKSWPFSKRPINFKVKFLYTQRPLQMHLGNPLRVILAN